MFFRSSQNDNESDDGLIHRFQSTGDLEYLGKLFDRYIHLVYGVCLKYLKDRELSQDATMQIFEKLMVELPKREVENFKPWLHVMSKNHCLMQLRAQKSKLEREGKLWKEQEEFMENCFELHPNNEEALEKNLDKMKKCIDQLKTEQKKCVSLFYLDEKCYQEISDQLQLELKKVKSYIQNGKRNLKICMEQNG